ncbi:hypothetical protein C8T65DRAFT_644096 [Cerioporus squamosus]|nr:hypothetical protein C8T65DRAFT_644096 [Cerioporus squamosus]
MPSSRESTDCPSIQRAPLISPRTIIRGRLYGHHGRPRVVPVVTTARSTSNIRPQTDFPHVEEYLGSRLYIHDCLIAVTDSSLRRHYFKIFFTRHIFQPPNRCLRSLDASLVWHGELLVMRVSAVDSSRLVHTRSGDAGLSAQAILRLSHAVEHRTHIPTFI